jgi:hypothetical protein
MRRETVREKKGDGKVKRERGWTDKRKAGIRK